MIDYAATVEGLAGKKLDMVWYGGFTLVQARILPPDAAAALRDNGSGGAAVFFYARLPHALPQFASHPLDRWANNIRAATVLGVVGAAGLGQTSIFALSLFGSARLRP